MPLLVYVNSVITGVDLLDDSTKVILDPPNILGIGLQVNIQVHFNPISSLFITQNTVQQSMNGQGLAMPKFMTLSRPPSGCGSPQSNRLLRLIH